MGEVEQELGESEENKEEGRNQPRVACEFPKREKVK